MQQKTKSLIQASLKINKCKRPSSEGSGNRTSSSGGLRHALPCSRTVTTTVIIRCIVASRCVEVAAGFFFNRYKCKRIFLHRHCRACRPNFSAFSTGEIERALSAPADCKPSRDPPPSPPPQPPSGVEGGVSELLPPTEEGPEAAPSSCRWWWW